MYIWNNGIIKEKKDSTKRLSNAYYEVIQNLWPLNDLPNVKFFSPYNFKNVLGNINELFKKMEAYDAKDLIIFFWSESMKKLILNSK